MVSFYLEEVCVALAMPSSNDNTITAVAAEKNQNSKDNTKVEIQDKEQTKEDKKLICF